MTEDERAAYVRDYPEVMTCPLPDGWNRLDTMPLTKPIKVLTRSGHSYDLPGASNALFLIASDKIIAWRP